MDAPKSPRYAIDRRTLLRSAVAVTAGAMVSATAGRRAPAATGGLTPVDLAGVESRWGHVAAGTDGRTIAVEAGAARLFPKIARLPVSFPRAGAAWRIEASVESRLVVGERPARRDIEDYALSFADGRVQLWYGAARTPGLRLLVDGQVAARAAAFAAPAGSVNLLTVAVAEDGTISAAGNGLALSVSGRHFAAAELAEGGPIDLVVRVGPAVWRGVAGSGLDADFNPGPPWRSRPGEPEWDPREAIAYGYQPQPTHRWNRWTAQLLPLPEDYGGLPGLPGGGATGLTHGPLLGLPASGELGVMVRTAAPATVELRGGPGGDASGWRTLAAFRTAPAAGNTGHARLGIGAFAPDETALHYGVAVNGVLTDTRVDGVWPRLHRRWLTAADRSTARLAVTHCDNFYPAVAPLLSPHWTARAAEADLLLHLGDHVYEQGYRRRMAVSRLDHLAHFAPGTAQAWRGRLLPAIGLFDDHDFYNDITATGDVGRFADLAAADGSGFLPDMPWRIASRDTGRAVWEEWVGWGTPQDSPDTVIAGAGRLTRGVLAPDEMAPWTALDEAQIAALAPLVVSPNSLPQPPWAIEPASAGAYLVAGVDTGRGLVRLDPAPLGNGRVAFGVSTPRYGSLRLGNAELLLLDTRTMRTMWRRALLLGRIRHSTADVLLIASSVTVSFANEAGRDALAKRDSWTGYAHERGLILDALRARGVRAVFLTGDLHSTAVRRLAPGLHEVICGAWSNIGYHDIVGAARLVAGFPDAALLWHGPNTSPDADWASWSTFVETGRDGAVSLEIVDTVADRTVHAMRLD